jgi:methyltransferase (TIGR00027 family)
MVDARSRHPVCGDTLAERFMDGDGAEVLERFRPYRRANASNVARHRIIDDLLRAELAADPARRVVVIGAGFDTRPYRLNGGRWVEVDHPELIAFKNQRLPAGEARNPLVRLPLNILTDSLAEALAAHVGPEPVVIVLEGVILYLVDSEIRGLARTLARLFPKALLICDLMSLAFMRRYGNGFRQEVRSLGAMFQDPQVHPAIILEAEGFRPRRHHSIVGRSATEGTAGMPHWLVGTFLKTLRDGYAVWEFEQATP